MRTEKIRKGFQVTKVELYDSIHDLTAWRNHYSHCYFLEDWNVGSDMESITKHFSNLYRYIAGGMQEEAYKEAQNLHNNLHNQIEKIDTRSLCMAPFVQSVNGKEFHDWRSSPKSWDMMRDLSEKGLTYEHMHDIIDSVKKKFSQNLESTFLTDLEVTETQIYISALKTKSEHK